jgi:hypothetical protein
VHGPDGVIIVGLPPSSVSLILLSGSYLVRDTIASGMYVFGVRRLRAGVPDTDRSAESRESPTINVLGLISR